jgi:hypothetical protein
MMEEGSTNSRRPTNAEYLAAARACARAEGKCIVCRQNRVEAGRSVCHGCVAKKEAVKRANQEDGRCRCGRERAPDRHACHGCLDAENARRVIEVAVAKTQGMCIACFTVPAVDGKQMCQPHLDANARRRKKNYRRRRDKT